MTEWRPGESEVEMLCKVVDAALASRLNTRYQGSIIPAESLTSPEV
jgi:hypothetical protein